MSMLAIGWRLFSSPSGCSRILPGIPLCPHASHTAVDPSHVLVLWLPLLLLAGENTLLKGPCDYSRPI